MNIGDLHFFWRINFMGNGTLIQKDPLANSTVVFQSCGKKSSDCKKTNTLNSVFTVKQKNASTEVKSEKKLTPAEIKANIKYDKENGILKNKDTSVSGYILKKGDYEFNYQRYKEIKGEDITFGGISKRYGLEPGTLKNANGLRFGASTGMAMQPGKGDNLNKYTPEDANLNGVIIPKNCIDKYLKNK